MGMTWSKTSCNDGATCSTNSLIERSAYCVAGDIGASIPSKMRLFMAVPGFNCNRSPYLGQSNPQPILNNCNELVHSSFIHQQPYKVYKLSHTKASIFVLTGAIQIFARGKDGKMEAKRR